MPEKMLPAVQRQSRKKIPPAQRAGARRRSPRSGSAAAGAHITRNAGRCAPIAPCGERRTRYTTCDSDALRHTDRGSTGVVGGVEGLAPLTPCRPPRRRPNPDTGLKPPASGNKNRLYVVKTENVTFCRSGWNLHAGEDAPRRTTRKPKKFPPAQRAGARRRSPRSGSAAAGAHIAREAGRCAPTCPLRRAADRVYDMRQWRPPPRGQGV